MILFVFTFDMIDNFLVTKLFKQTLTKKNIMALVGTEDDPREMFKNLKLMFSSIAKKNES